MPNDDRDIAAAEADRELTDTMHPDEQRTAAVRVARSIWGDAAATKIGELLDQTAAPDTGEEP